MSGNELEPQNPTLIQGPGSAQISESRNKPLQNTTTDMLSELAMKFNTMKKLQSLINDFFALDQKCCIEFLEKTLEELKKPQNVQASAGLRVTAPKVEENRTNVNIVTQNTTTIINSNDSIQETLPSAAVNTNLLGENYHSVDENLHKKMWTLANRISDSVTRALMLDEAPNDIQKNKRKNFLVINNLEHPRCMTL